MIGFTRDQLTSLTPSRNLIGCVTSNQIAVRHAEQTNNILHCNLYKCLEYSQTAKSETEQNFRHLQCLSEYTLSVLFNLLSSPLSCPLPVDRAGLRSQQLRASAACFSHLLTQQLHLTVVNYLKGKVNCSHGEKYLKTVFL